MNQDDMNPPDFHDHESPPNSSRMQPWTRKGPGRDDILDLSPSMKVRRFQAVPEAGEQGKW